jgi:hypothetical protein
VENGLCDKKGVGACLQTLTLPMLKAGDLTRTDKAVVSVDVRIPLTRDRHAGRRASGWTGLGLTDRRACLYIRR